jgi:hypothetical protein
MRQEIKDSLGNPHITAQRWGALDLFIPQPCELSYDFEVVGVNWNLFDPCLIIIVKGSKIIYLLRTIICFK